MDSQYPLPENESQVPDLWGISQIEEAFTEAIGPFDCLNGAHRYSSGTWERAGDGSICCGGFPNEEDADAFCSAWQTPSSYCKNNFSCHVGSSRLHLLPWQSTSYSSYEYHPRKTRKTDYYQSSTTLSTTTNAAYEYSSFPKFHYHFYSLSEESTAASASLSKFFGGGLGNQDYDEYNY